MNSFSLYTSYLWTKSELFSISDSSLVILTFSFLLLLDYQFQIECIDSKNLLVTYDNKTYPVEIRSFKDELVLLIDGHQFRCRVHIDGDTCTFYSNVSRGSFDFKLQTPSFLAQFASTGAAGGSADPIAPMPGIIDKILVQEGTNVTQGQPLLVMTAMKMEHVIKASKNGIIGKVNATPGKVVKKGEVLLTYIVDDDKKQKSH